jgi:hypothetical protein
MLCDWLLVLMQAAAAISRLTAWQVERLDLHEVTCVNPTSFLCPLLTSDITGLGLIETLAMQRSRQIFSPSLNLSLAPRCSLDFMVGCFSGRPVLTNS